MTLDELMQEDPQRGLVVLLQLKAAGVISMRTLREHLPWALDHEEEERRVQRELDDARLRAYSPYAYPVQPAYPFH